jgi:hypothetical protein
MTYIRSTDPGRDHLPSTKSWGGAARTYRQTETIRRRWSERYSASHRRFFWRRTREEEHMDKLESSHLFGVRMRERERTLLEKLAQDERRSLAAMIRELIIREADRRLVGATDAN